MSDVAPDDRDLAIRTMLGEEGSEAGQAGVAAVILNRVAAGSYGGSVGDVVLAPRQFEAWSRQSDQLLGIKRNDPRYVEAGQIFDAVRSGAIPDPTDGATHFYAPVAQAALGRKSPDWAKGQGLKLGSSMFYAPQGRVDRRVDPSKIAGNSPSQIAGEFPTGQLPSGATLFQPSTSKAAAGSSDQLPPGATLFQPGPGFVEKGAGALGRVATDPDPLSREKVGEQIDAVYGAGRENVEQGIARMKSGNIAGGAFQGIAGTLQEAASVPAGWGLALLGLGQYGDPMMVGAEAPHIASMGDAAKYARAGEEGRAAVEAPAPAPPTLASSNAPVPPAPPPAVEPSAPSRPPVPLPPGAKPIEPSTTALSGTGKAVEETARSSESPVTINFRGEPYPGATRLDAVTAAQRATGVSMDRIWDETTPERGSQGKTLPPDIPTKVYQGSGRADQSSAYNQAMGPQSVPIAGPGRYYAFTKSHAQEFGPNVAEAEIPTKNPLVIRDGNVWRELTRKAGWQTPNPFGSSEAQMREMTQRLQEVVRGMGHDGIVAYWDDSSPYDIGPKGENFKLLRATFGVPQAVAFEERAAARDLVREEPSPPVAARPSGAGAAVTPPSALLPPAAPEPKTSVIQPVRDFAHAIRAIFDAPRMSGDAKAAAGFIRESRGLSKRAAEQARATLEPFMRQVRKLSVDNRFNLVYYIETRTEGGVAWFMKDTALQPVADALRDVLWRVRNTLEDMPPEAGMGFVENYYPHQWVDPKKTGEFVRQWVARMGEGGFTKKRSVPTVLDGVRAGLVPRTTDPIEAVLLYIENAYQFISHNRTFNEAKDAGFIKLATSGEQPEGWVRLNGRLADRGFVKAWAPEDFARVYNNALSTLSGPAGDVVNGLRRTFNIITGLELAWPGFHMSAMAMEAFANKIASALGDATRWRLDQTAIKLVTSPAAPITTLRRGSEAQRIYRSLTDGSAEMREIVDLLTRADFRFTGKGRAADEYRFSGADNYFKAIHRGTLLTELNADLKRAGRQPIVGAGAVVLRNIGRAMETVTAPLFEYAIPKLKSGAAVDLMSGWLRGHPNATVEEKLARAREIANVIDDRFGEMNQDSLFWHANLRAGAQMALLSFSWEMGFLRTAVGGAIDWAKFPFTRRQTERMGYLVALPLAIAAVNGASTYLHTGEAPSGMDFVAARTGGKNPDGTPERASIPSWARNVLSWANVLTGPKRGAFADELYGMANPGVKDILDFARNSDWHGDPIFSSAPDAPPWLKQVLQHIVEQHIPMPLQLGSQPKPGTGITGLESILGVRPAPFFMQEPDLYQSIYDKKNVKEWKAAQKFRERQRALHGQ